MGNEAGLALASGQIFQSHPGMQGKIAAAQKVGTQRRDGHRLAGEREYFVVDAALKFDGYTDQNPLVARTA